MSRASSKENAAVVKLRQCLRGLGEVRPPSDAEEPILAFSVRKAVASWLVEINNADELKEAGVTPRSTALFYGPPGCGKTTLAHHLAARLGVPLVIVGSENLFGKYFGEAERNVASLFEGLRMVETPCVVLLDEIDAIGSKRGDASESGGATAARNSALNVLLRKIEDYRGVMIGATNLSDRLDPALWRRFGMQIDVALPSADERYAIFARYAAPFEFGEEAFEILTDLSEGAPPSLLRQLIEGVKRLLIIGDRIGVSTTSPVQTFRAALSQNRPHPDYAPPALWDNPDAVETLALIDWPPRRAA